MLFLYKDPPQGTTKYIQPSTCTVPSPSIPPPLMGHDGWTRYTQPAVEFCWWPDTNFKNELANCVNGKELFFPYEYYSRSQVSEGRHVLAQSSTAPLPWVIISTGTWFPHGKTSFSESNQGNTWRDDDSARGRLSHSHSPEVPLPDPSLHYPCLCSGQVVSRIISRHHCSRRGAGGRYELCG